MYIPKAFEETRLDVLHELMRAHPFGCFVSPGEGRLLINHLPFLLDAGAGEFGTLKGHVARANPLWEALSGSMESAVVFQGPHSYVSPNWYPSKHQTGKLVPTWNYAVVHAHGLPKVVEDPAWLLDLVTQLSDVHEASQRLPWKVSDAPPDFTERLLEMIVGIEIPIARIEGKWKLSQNRSRADRTGLAAGLEARDDDASRAMAAMVVQSLQEQDSPSK